MIKHPCGGAPVAIAEFIAAEHSVLAISHFIESFRRAEACIYGYKNVITPKHVVIDRSLVLLLSFLRVYNFETVSDYLHRCFRVVMGCAEDPDDFNKLFVHACISHVMNSAKSDLRNSFKYFNQSVVIHCSCCMYNNYYIACSTFSYF